MLLLEITRNRKRKIQQSPRVFRERHNRKKRRSSNQFPHLVCRGRRRDRRVMRVDVSAAVTNATRPVTNAPRVSLLLVPQIKTPAFFFFFFSFWPSLFHRRPPTNHFPDRFLYIIVIRTISPAMYSCVCSVSFVHVNIAKCYSFESRRGALTIGG